MIMRCPPESMTHFRLLSVDVKNLWGLLRSERVKLCAEFKVVARGQKLYQDDALLSTSLTLIA
jgi:hypothetical protein